jgi:hypothetical protein
MDNNISSRNLLHLLDTPLSPATYANLQPTFAVSLPAEAPRSAKQSASRYEKQPGDGRARNMPKKDSALILRTWRGALDWRDVYAEVKDQLSSPRTISQIKCHIRMLVQRAGGSWRQALDDVMSFRLRPRRFRRKCPFSARVKLAIALALRDCYHDRRRFKIVTERMKVWFRRNGVPSFIDVDSTGTGSGTLHEKIKNHVRNNIDIRFRGNLEAAIAAATLEVEQEASEALPTPRSNAIEGSPSPSTTHATSWQHESATPPSASDVPVQFNSPLPPPSYTQCPIIPSTASQNFSIFTSQTVNTSASQEVPPSASQTVPPSAFYFTSTVASLVAEQPAPALSPSFNATTPSDLVPPSQCHTELTYEGFSLSDPQYPFHPLTLSIRSEDNELS